jgi:hypothetical protein
MRTTGGTVRCHEGENVSASLKKLLQGTAQTGELLVSRRYEEYIESHSNILVDEVVGDFIKSELTTPQRNRRMTFSASARGVCPREQVFQFTHLQPSSRFSTSLIAIFHQGTFMHLKWQALLLDAGILDRSEVPCTWDQYNLTGTIDGAGAVPEEHILSTKYEHFGWEFKSINSNGYRYVLSNGPKHQHLLQIHAYMLATGWRVWSLCYENKDTQEWKEYTVFYDDKIAEEVQLELAYLNDCVDTKTLPPILSECRQRKGPYKNCAFAHVCLDQDEWPERPPRTIKLR